MMAIRAAAPVAIVDHAWLLPGNLNWEQLLAAKSAVAHLGDQFPVPMGAAVLDPGPTPTHEFSVLPRAVHLAHTALHQLKRDPQRRYGLILGLPNLYSETAYMEHALEHREDPSAMGPLLPFSTHFPLSFLADSVGAGPRVRLDAACATGNDALIAAAQWLQSGFVDDVLVVAASAMLNPVGLGLFHNLKALNDADDLEASCPFDARRRGFVMGEGAAALWLSNHPPHKPKGYLWGAGQSMSANHFVEPPTDLSTWLKAACAATSSIAPEELAYISAHGTATRAGDLAETRLLHALLGSCATQVPISSVKSMLGHTLAASALIEAIVCLEALTAKMAPPTAHLRVPDPACDLDFIPLAARAIEGNFALSNAFGFGGHNSCVLLAGESS